MPPPRFCGDAQRVGIVGIVGDVFDLTREKTKIPTIPLRQHSCVGISKILLWGRKTIPTIPTIPPRSAQLSAQRRPHLRSHGSRLPPVLRSGGTTTPRAHAVGGGGDCSHRPFTRLSIQYIVRVLSNTEVQRMTGRNSQSTTPTATGPAT
jgi:hypothetical protein